MVSATTPRKKRLLATLVDQKVLPGDAELAAFRFEIAHLRLTLAACDRHVAGCPRCPAERRDRCIAGAAPSNRIGIVQLVSVLRHTGCGGGIAVEEKNLTPERLRSNQ